MKAKWFAATVAVGCGLGAILPTATRAQDGWGLDARNNRNGQLYAINHQNELLKLDANMGSSGLLGNLLGSLNRNGGVDVTWKRRITGLRSGDRLVGIDFRPSDSRLYALGSPNGGPGLGQIYVIRLNNGVATPIGAGDIPLEGSAFGFDFNPVPDLIRITSNSGENKRASPVTGALVQEDGPLAYPALGDPNSTRSPGIVASAYTNPDTDPLTHTVLYGIDAAREGDASGGGDVLVIQIPPNAGTLNTVGRLRVDATEVVGLDISAGGSAIAALQRTGASFSRLVSIDLASGQARDLGKIGRGRGEAVSGIAIQVGL